MESQLQNLEFRNNLSGIPSECQTIQDQALHFVGPYLGQN